MKLQRTDAHTAFTSHFHNTLPHTSTPASMQPARYFPVSLSYFTCPTYLCLIIPQAASTTLPPTLLLSAQEPSMVLLCPCPWMFTNVRLWSSSRWNRRCYCCALDARCYVGGLYVVRNVCTWLVARVTKLSFSRGVVSVVPLMYAEGGGFLVLSFTTAEYHFTVSNDFLLLYSTLA